MRSANRPIAASARSISSPASVSHGRGSAARASSHTDAPSVKLSNPGVPAATHPATSGSSPRPACSPISRAATSSPARQRCNAASIATCTIRIDSGIASAAARRSGPLPSQRSVRYARLAATAAGAPVCSASIPATSQLAAIAGRDNRTIRGRRCAICTARAGPRRPGREGPDQAGHHLTAGPVHQRVEVLGQRTTEHPGGQMRVRRAARVRQQAPVIRLHRGLTVDTKPICQPHRDHGRLQAVLEREPHAKVGRKAQGGDDLSGAQLPGCGPGTVRTHAADTTEDSPKLNGKEQAGHCIAPEAPRPRVAEAGKGASIAPGPAPGRHGRSWPAGRTPDGPPRAHRPRPGHSICGRRCGCTNRIPLHLQAALSVVPRASKAQSRSRAAHDELQRSESLRGRRFAGSLRAPDLGRQVPWRS